MYANIHFALLAVLVIVAFFTDVRSMRIPNAITTSGTMAGFALHGIMNGWAGLGYALVGFAAGFIPLLLLYWLGALGAGDVKLFGAIGAVGGAFFVLYCVMYSLIYAGIIAVVVLILSKQQQYWKKISYFLMEFLFFREINVLRGLKKHATIRFPFMYAVLPAILTVGFYTFISSGG